MGASGNHNHGRWDDRNDAHEPAVQTRILHASESPKRNAANERTVETLMSLPQCIASRLTVVAGKISASSSAEHRYTAKASNSSADRGKACRWQ